MKAPGLMDVQYVEPTRAGRIRILLWTGALGLGSIAFLLFADAREESHWLLIEQARVANCPKEFMEIFDRLMLEVAVFLLLVGGATAAGMVWYITKIRRAGQWALPGAPVFFRTLIRTEPRYIKRCVVFGYLAAGIWLFHGMLGFYALHLFRAALM